MRRRKDKDLTRKEEKDSQFDTDESREGARRSGLPRGKSDSMGGCDCREKRDLEKERGKSLVKVDLKYNKSLMKATGK